LLFHCSQKEVKFGIFLYIEPYSIKYHNEVNKHYNARNLRSLRSYVGCRISSYASNRTSGTSKSGRRAKWWS
jgi:hypothetical protein